MISKGMEFELPSPQAARGRCVHCDETSDMLTMIMEHDCLKGKRPAVDHRQAPPVVYADVDWGTDD